MKVSFLMLITRRVAPKTKDKLAIFEPITFPIIMVPLASRAAKKVVSISGAEVPKAITVEPIKNGESPKFRAVETEYLSNLSALIQITIIPSRIGIKAFSNIFTPRL